MRILTTRPGPVKEELVTLQKQILELQNETKARLDESTPTIDALSAKMRKLEGRRTVRAVSRPRTASKKTGSRQE